MTDNAGQGREAMQGATGNHGEGDDNKRIASMVYNGEERKLRALAGQWKTPPMPAYSTVSTDPSQQSQHVPHTTAASSDASLPMPGNIPEDYAKALQEAYRQGTEAGARAAQQHQQQQQQQQQIPNAASCPNFSTGSQQPAHGSLPNATTGISPIDERKEIITHSFPIDHQIHPAQHHHAPIPDPLSSSMPPPPPTASQHPPPVAYAPHPSVEQQQRYLQPHQTNVNPHPQLQQLSTAQPILATSATQSTTKQAPPTKASNSQQQPGRSLSMPDMSTYAAEAEEEKRLKRLARNRASARLRRLRKKNLVDAYETEVGILEKTLKQLGAHEWGKDTQDHKALLDALGMERGQQAITPEERTAIINDILTQQMQQVSMLQQAQREQEVLSILASSSFGNVDVDSEEEEMMRELQDLLQLSDEQRAKLQQSSKGLKKEVEALETVAASLEAMQKNDWLLNEGVQSITDQFKSILHKNQQSKLLLWTDTNAEAVDQLDHVQVQPLQNAPVFSFGVESNTHADDE